MLKGLRIEVTDVLIPVIIALGSFIVLMILRSVLYKAVHRWAQKTQTTLDDMIVSATRAPSMFWAVILALYLGVAGSELPARYLTYTHRLLSSLIILSITLVAASLLAKTLSFYQERRGIALQATGLSKALVKIFVLSIGFLILLSNLGVSITPLITAAGIGGLAIALALQDSLANFFSGIHIMIERPIEVGHYIKLQSGEEGYVVDIGWRTTRVRMLPNNLIIIPNKTLAESIITNYYLPERRMSVLIPLGVSYDSDPEQVERLLVEEATKAAGEVPGLLAEPAPFVRFIPGFGDSSLNFTLICQVKEFTDQYLVQHELRKRIFRRFREEGIEIPFPIRTVYLREERNGKVAHAQREEARNPSKND